MKAGQVMKTLDISYSILYNHISTRNGLNADFEESYLRH